MSTATDEVPVDREPQNDGEPPTVTRGTARVRALSRLHVALLGTAVLATATAVALGTAAGHHPGSDQANHALVDRSGTAEVAAQASEIVETVFSFTPHSVGTTERAATRSLTGDAVKEYDKLYGDLLDKAQATHLSLRTSVASIGVQRLNGDRATVLVFANQRSEQQGAGSPTLGAAQLQLELLRIDGRWMLERITLL